MKILPMLFNSDVEALLIQHGLPYEDLSGATQVTLFGIKEGEDLVAMIGVEAYQEEGLIRSLAVNKAHQGSALGRALVQHAENWANNEGIKALYLLTTTAKEYFSLLGYQVISRQEAPTSIGNTEQFSSLCPASASFMKKALIE
ncbi:arsenic resistance N-acetyltransferase ArsN2 [Marinomonas sp. THO17]|uniref:arsenic resistance N-acetyltransferase ArsN2 n=1 Tax=Marinomonas sp. THO17 TaxID=3149048 RepID=UPI00336BD764